MLSPRPDRKKSPGDRLIQEYEKKLFDARQLVEISKSLNSSLDYNAVVQSILYICMGQLKVLKAGLFARREIDRQHLYLHRSMLGFDIDHEVEYLIPEGHPILLHLQEDFRTHTWHELVTDCPEASRLECLASLEPSLVVPLRSKSYINGVLVLGEPIEGRSMTQDERAYVMDIAALAGIAVHNAFLYEVTTTDIMTKLKLRHYFTDVLQDLMASARKEGKSLSLIMADIDHFKNFNDTRGHLCGDEMIRTVAAAILTRTRQTDLAARYGGEEFVIVLPDTDLLTAVSIAERIRLGVQEAEVQYQGKPVGVTLSMGVAGFDALKDQNTQDFLRRADDALYVSKHEGRNRVTTA